MNRRVSLDGLPALRDVIDAHGLSAKKNLGQNFILDLNLTDKIARLAGPLGGRLVIEVGPGPGGLTRALLAGGARHVIAIERDDRCLPALADIAAHWPGRLSVHAADALEADWNAIVEPARSNVDEKVLIIANLPYGIATKLLIQWLETEPWPPWFDGMALMFQKEVAERIVAAPATKPYGRLAIIAQWRCQCDIAMTLGPEAFTPPPKVASAVVRFKPRAEIQPNCDVIKLGQVSRTLFGQRRKMLRATLKPLFRDPEDVLARLGIAPTARAETLSVAEIANIALEMERSK
ncbi:MAG: 16S rRNA (adenine(1518)-N(6)/adenine(1519)-N(6))-dimethyltransferase RsmA [Hyphomicrobiaceae bacterium]